MPKNAVTISNPALDPEAIAITVEQDIDPEE